MKKLFMLLLAGIVLTGSVVFALTNEKPAPLTDAEKDGYILFKYCWDDARALDDKSSETIIIKKINETKKYVFADHVLSCGTHMYGYIKETPQGDRMAINGSFTVSNNAYFIYLLVITLSKDIQTEKISGTITVNTKKIDYNQFLP